MINDPLMNDEQLLRGSVRLVTQMLWRQGLRVSEWKNGKLLEV